MKADDLKHLAALWLRARKPDAHILFEFSLAEYGGALIDVAAICEDEIIGVEIKGDGDSASRLKLQGQMYPRVCRTVYLLPSPDLLKSCRTHLPPEWSLLLPLGGDDDNEWRLLQTCEETGIQYPKNGKAIDPSTLGRGEGLGLSPAALAAMVWTTEYTRLKIALDPMIGLPRRKADCIRYVAETYPLPKIERAVCQVLRQRDWGFKEVIKPMAAGALS
ncbi:hypothetical protein [Henriciella aquimarina]|uniref:hypothetical protein n=1 Tax=Henriciella aquimarina TaxID=545261 RepID=UPI000A00BB1A|nr:hypothetical protein [Henriciella aquimarina]